MPPNSRFAQGSVCLAIAALAAGTASLHGQVRGPATAPATRPAGRVEKAPNPHWNTRDCNACHRLAANGEVLPIPPAQVNDVCWKCHDGKRAHQEVHPVARAFAGKDVVNPGWPAPDNQLSCLTCHDFGRGHARGGPRPERNAWMLREYTGGVLNEWCAKCHVASPAHKPFNPHVMLNENGQVNARNCLLCHRVSEGFDRKVRLGKPDLITDEISLCVRCHTRHLDWFTPGHIGIPVPPAIKAYMLAREDAGWEAAVSPEQVESLLGSPREPEVLPLGMNDRVVCSTCHNPHEAGLFPPDSILARGAMKMRKNKEEPLTMRSGSGRGICRGCHNK